MPIGSNRRTALALLLAALLAIGVTACGSDDGGGSYSAQSDEREPLDKTDYQNAINSAQTDFGAQAAELDLASPSSANDFKRSLDELGVLIDELTTRLDGIEPPDSVASQHAALVTQLTEYGDTIDESKGGLSSGDQERIADSAKELGKASTSFSQDFSSTVEQINTRLN